MLNKSKWFSLALFYFQFWSFWEPKSSSPLWSLSRQILKASSKFGNVLNGFLLWTSSFFVPCLVFIGSENFKMMTFLFGIVFFNVVLINLTKPFSKFSYEQLGGSTHSPAKFKGEGRAGGEEWVCSHAHPVIECRRQVGHATDFARQRCDSLAVIISFIPHDTLPTTRITT